MKKDFFRKYLPTIITFIAIFVLGYYIYRNTERLSQIFNLSWKKFSLIFVFVLLTAMQNGTINYLLYRDLGAPISVMSGFGLATINTLANQLPFAGGLIAKGLYLNKKYRLPYAQYLSATGALYICFLATNGIAGLLGILYLYWLKGYPIPIILIIGFGLMVGSLVFLWFPIKVSYLPKRWHSVLEQMKQGWSVFKDNPTLLYRLIAIQTMSIATMSARFWLAFHIFSQDVTLPECLLFASATILTRLVSIAPGGLGIREGIVAGIAAMLGFAPGISALAVGLDRLVATITIAILGTIFTYLLSKEVMQETNIGEGD